MAETLDNKYYYVHWWITRHWGKANKCERKNCQKISKTFNWAKKRGVPYEPKRRYFMQLCVSCHRKYDFTEETRQKMIQGALRRKRTPEEIQKLIARAKARIGEKRSEQWVEMMRKLSSKPVEQLQGGVVISVFKSLREAAKAVGVHHSAISLAIRGKTRKSGGYEWRTAH